MGTKKTGRLRQDVFIVETRDQKSEWTPCKLDKNAGFYHSTKAYTTFRNPKLAEEFMQEVVVTCLREGIGITGARVFDTENENVVARARI